jgi:hypothetical protein
MKMRRAVWSVRRRGRFYFRQPEQRLIDLRVNDVPQGKERSTPEQGHGQHQQAGEPDGET